MGVDQQANYANDMDVSQLEKHLWYMANETLGVWN